MQLLLEISVPLLLQQEEAKQPFQSVYIANDGGAPIAGPGDHAIGLGVDTHAHGTHSICIGRRSISDFFTLHCYKRTINSTT